MTDNKVAVKEKEEDDFPDVPEAGDQVTKFVLCNRDEAQWQINPQ